MASPVQTVRPPPSARGASGGEAHVVRFVAEGARREAVLREGTSLVLGRGAEADLALGDETISRRHALLVVADGQLLLEDLGSANGTSIDGRALTAGVAHAFAPGALLQLGEALGTVHAPHDRVAASTSEGTAAVTAFAAGLGRGPASVCAFDGSGVEKGLSLLEALVPPSGHVARVAARRVVCVLPGLSHERTKAWAKVLTTYLAASRVYVAHEMPAVSDRAPAAEQLAALTDAPAAHASPRRAPVVGKAMRRVFDLVHHVAATPTSVLVLGETGAGKEVIARTIHARSDRASGPFVALNCAALPEALLEGELFGYEKGAFTGATQAKPGLVETAAGGTLFLDELGEMPLPTQSKLLRVLEDGAVLRLGSLKPRPVSFRLLAATNRDVQEEIRAKRFRADLYYRINGLTVRLPPLRERRDEIEALVELFARRAAEKLGRVQPRLAAEVEAALLAYEWPGNVRELRNVVERLVLLASDGVADVEHLPEELLAAIGTAPAPASEPPPSTRQRPREPASLPEDGALTDSLARLERERILEALERCAGNQTRAAAALGITRRVLIRRLERYGVARPRK